MLVELPNERISAQKLYEDFEVSKNQLKLVNLNYSIFLSFDSILLYFRS